MTSDSQPESGGVVSSTAWLDARVEISRIGINGQIEETHYGPTNRELLQAHEAGKCDAMCSFCYAEASASNSVLSDPCKESETINPNKK